MPNIPRRPVGSDPEGYFMGRIWDVCFGPEGRLLDSDTVQWSHTPKGHVGRAASGGGAGSTPPSMILGQVFYIQQEQSNFIKCRAIGKGTLAKATVLETTGHLNTLILTAGGQGYAVPPAIVFIDPTGTGGAATCTVAGGAVTSVTLTNVGTGYTSPSVVFVDSGNNVNVAKPQDLRGFISTKTDSQGTPQMINGPLGGYAYSNELMAIQPNGGTIVAGCVWEDVNNESRVLMTQLTTCETIGGIQVMKSRWVYCSPYF